ncbi:MAG: ribosome biogenesis GTPase Der [Phycisphaeraceae bacterium]
MLPKVVIVGRPNVGKSSLLNLLAGRRISIVDPTSGVTRDRVSTTVELPPTDADDEPARSVELIDTGGFGIQDEADLTAEVERQIALGIADAALILFVVDIQTGITPLDEQVARMLRTAATATPVLLVTNKVDGEPLEPAAYEMTPLGFGDPVMVSATSGYRKRELLEAIRDTLDWHHVAASPDATPQGVLLAIVGKRNAGKSTLVNALAGADRVIVSHTEGTTRDSVDVRFELNGHSFTAIDTAGVRKTKSLRSDIDYYSRHRSLRSVRRADVVLLLIDAAVPISQVDRQLANEIIMHHRPCVIVVNKWDLAEQNYTQQQYADYLDDALKGLDFAPLVFASAKKGQGVRDAVAMALNLYDQAGHRVATGELNRVMEQVLARHMPASKLGKRPKVYYVTQLDTDPPTIALFVNDPSLFDAGYQRYVINRLRGLLPFSEVPIKLLIRGKQKMTAEQRLASEQSSDK